MRVPTFLMLKLLHKVALVLLVSVTLKEIALLALGVLILLSFSLCSIIIQRLVYTCVYEERSVYLGTYVPQSMGFVLLSFLLY